MDTAETAREDIRSAPLEPSLEIDSVAVLRLIEEIRTSEPVMSGNYNRTYNRHNR